MQHQLTVRLPAELAERLDRAAQRLRRKRSEIVRLALEQFLAVEIEERPIERVRDLLGQIESGIPDLGQRHREYLLRRLRDGR
jgi:predicted transcriptional regulator